MDVQSNVEGDPDPDQGHAITPVHNMEETTVQEVRTRVVTATLIPVQVGHSCFSNFILKFGRFTNMQIQIRKRFN